MNLIMTAQNKRMHPHKFTLLVALGCIVMMFAGLTSAYIVKRNQANWTTFDLPVIFWYSSVVIIISSITMRVSKNYFVAREMAKYRQMLFITMLLGIAFVVLQFIGFRQLNDSGITFTKNVAFSFLYTLVGLHALHVVGGLIALLVIFARAFSSKSRNYSVVPIEMMSTYWFFVDVLWIYLFIFLQMIR